MRPSTALLLGALLALPAGCSDRSPPPQRKTPAATGRRTAMRPSRKWTPEQRARTYLARINRGDYAGAARLHDAEMKKAMPVSTLKSTWESLVTQVGKWKTFKKVETRPMGGHEIVLLTTRFADATLVIQVTVNARGRVAGLWLRPEKEKTYPYTPPKYVKAGKYVEEKVTVGRGKWMLGGTLTLPVSTGKPLGLPPVLVLVHGSGPNDRDESIGPNKPFRDLALGLACRGVAVLRYDKRTHAHPMRFMQVYGRKGYTGKELVVDDAVAALQLMRKDPRVDRNRIFVLGHSMGGYFLPRVAHGAPFVKGLVIMAGNSRPLEDLILAQVRYLSKLKGYKARPTADAISAIRAAVARVKDPKLKPDTSAKLLPLGIPATFWLDVRYYDPAQEAKMLSQRILVLSGARDYQVTAKDFSRWNLALARRRSVTFRRYPRLNHLFIRGKGRPTPVEYQKAGHVAKVVVVDIAAFVRGAKKR